MNPHRYLVEMTFPPFASLPSPQEAVAFAERMALPTFDALEQLQASGKIVAGGTPLAAAGLTFIAEADSPEELESMVAGLPLWPRAQTRVVPLATFESRASTLRGRLAALRAAAQAPAPASRS